MSDFELNEAIEKGFSTLGTKVVNKIMKVHLKKYAKDLQKDVKPATPKDTKELSQKITAKVGKRSTVAANYLVGVDYDKFKKFSLKAIVQEYGSPEKNQPAQSYMRDTFAKDYEAIAKGLVDNIMKDIAEAMK